MSAEDVKWFEYFGGTISYSREDILEEAASRKLPLPDLYLDNLQANGGMRPEPDSIILQDGEEISCAYLLLLSSEGIENAQGATIQFKRLLLGDWMAMADMDLPDDIWPFASDGAEILFCFKLSEKGNLEIIMADMTVGPNEPEAFRFIASSYSQFLDLLQSI